MKQILGLSKKYLALFSIMCSFGIYGQTTFNVGIIKADFAPIKDMVKVITQQTNEIVQTHPEVDMLLTPEYSLYDITASENVYIRLTKQGNIYVLNPSDGSDIIIRHLNKILNLAVTNHVGFVLGTIPLKLDIDQGLYPNLPSAAVFNTTLFINKKGEIFDYDLKVRGSDWILPERNYPAFEYLPTADLPNYTEGYPIFEDRGIYLVANNTDAAAMDAVNFTNQTTKVRSFFKQGVEFRYAALTCAERHSFEMLDLYKDEKVDVVFYNEWEGFYWFDDVMEAIQSGENTANFVHGNTNIDIQVPYAWPMFQRDLYKEFANRNMIDEHTYLVATDSKNGLVGAFRYDFKPIDNNAIDFSQEWVYVEIPGPTQLSTNRFDNNVSISLFLDSTQNQLHVMLSSQTELDAFSIIDFSGKVLKQGRISSTNQVGIDVSFLNEGVYCIRLEGKEGHSSFKKFVIHK